MGTMETAAKEHKQRYFAISVIVILPFSHGAKVSMGSCYKWIWVISLQQGHCGHGLA